MKKYQFYSLAILVIFLFGIMAGLLLKDAPASIADDLRLDEQEATIRAINKVIPAVVSIAVYDEVDVGIIRINDTTIKPDMQKAVVGNGTGFIFDPNGMIMTNKHVVEVASPEKGEYRVILNTGREYYAQLIDKDPIKDIAILKIFDNNLPFVELSDSHDLAVGASVIAIGNVLGRYQNSATKGIVSALGRFLYANNDGKEEILDNVIQTDAEINKGNSGGPLINLDGKVVGVNVAIDEAGQSIGFAIPVNDIKPAIRTINKFGRIVRSRLGVYYTTLTPYMAEKNKLTRSEGAWLYASNKDIDVIVNGGPAEKAGFEAGDIIFEINSIPINQTNTLSSVVQNYNPGNKIGLKVQRGDQILIKEVTLDEF